MAGRKPCRFCHALKTSYLPEFYVSKSDQRFPLTIGGKTPSKEQIGELMSDVRLLRQVALWKLLMETVRNDAMNLGIREAQSFDHTLLAKAMLHVVGLQESILLVIEKEFERTKDQK